MGDLIDRAEAISRAVELRMYGKPVKMVAVSELERLPKRGETTPPEQADSDRLGVKTGETCEDVISRQEAIDLFPDDDLEWDTKGGYIAPHLARQMICELPSAQPEERTNKRTETHACDCISRQMLLEYIHGEPVGKLLCDKYNLDGLIEQFPSAQPEIVKCKDCKHYKEWESEFTPNAVVTQCMADNFPIRKAIPDGWFCAGAERKRK